MATYLKSPKRKEKGILKGCIGETGKGGAWRLARTEERERKTKEFLVAENEKNIVGPRITTHSDALTSSTPCDEPPLARTRPFPLSLLSIIYNIM